MQPRGMGVPPMNESERGMGVSPKSKGDRGMGVSPMNEGDRGMGVPPMSKHSRAGRPCHERANDRGLARRSATTFGNRQGLVQ